VRNAVLSVEGYFNNRTTMGEHRARSLYVSQDNRSTIILVNPAMPKCSNKVVWGPLNDWIHAQINDFMATDRAQNGPFPVFFRSLSVE
jgi:hypothetical protein